MSAGWENARGGTVIARHEFKGLSKLPKALEDWVEKKRLEGEEPPRRSMPQRIPGAFFDDEDYEDEQDFY